MLEYAQLVRVKRGNNENTFLMKNGNEEINEDKLVHSEPILHLNH